MIIVNNRAGILDGEKTVLDVFKERIARALKNNEEISFYVAVGFFFFEGFQKIYPLLKDLDEKNLLKEFKIVMGPETRKNTKEILEALKKDAVVLNDEIFEFIKKLYDVNKFDFRIFLERAFHIKLYIFDFARSGSEVWAGSANLTEAGLAENIELIVPTGITIEEKDLYKQFFNKIWNKSSDKVDNLKVIDIVRKASLSETLYLYPRDFIASLLKIMGKEYLVKNISLDLSYLGEFQNMSYYLCLEKMKTYGGVILANSYGLGKTYVGCLIARYYKDLGKRVLIIYPPVLEDHWKKTLEKVGLNITDVEWLSRGLLQKSNFNYEKYKNIDLILVDEAHHFRTSKPKSNRRENLENISKINPNSQMLLITATPINTSLLDFTELIKLFAKSIYKERFETEGILSKIYEIEHNVKSKEITKNTIEKLNELIRKFTIRIEWSDIIKYFPDDLRKISGKEKIENPEVFQVTYKYDEEIIRNIFDNIVPFLDNLNFEYTKLWEKEYKEDKNLIWWYKWRLYKRLESSITAFKISLENILEKNIFLKEFLTKVITNIKYEEKTNLFSKERLENIKNTFLSLSKSKKEEILDRFKSDINFVNNMLKNIQMIQDLEVRDEKINKLIEILEKEKKPTIVFSESRDTVIYIGNKLKKYGKFKFQLAYGGEIRDEEFDGEFEIPTIDKDKIQEYFNKGKFDILITTDIMGEGTNLPGPENKNPIIINFDLSYNPVRLIQRDGRAIRIDHPKKVFIYNFEPDERIDKELELCDRVAKRIENIISTIGLDFIIWAIEEKKIKKFSEKNRKRTIKLIREYKDLLATKTPEEIRKRFTPTLSKEDKSLREFIKYWGISEETLNYFSGNYRKPIFTGLKKNNNIDYFVVFEYRGGIHTLGEIIFSEKNFEANITKIDLEKINSLISEKCLELDKEFLKVVYRKDRLDFQIEKLLEKNEKLKNIFRNIDISCFTKNNKKIILDSLKKIDKIPPWKKEIEIEKLQALINKKIINGYQKSMAKPKLLAVIKYV
ncbi:MAG: helicase-related protein [Candidatus Aenigmatarchaeota archaeon]|nr:NgoFVII family restriction endonuclease [Candidatus Aenigmarchaeota archaeon]